MISDKLNVDDLIKGVLIDKHPQLLNADELFSVLGVPDDVAKERKNVEIYKYNNWEFTYYKKKLMLIMVNDKFTDGETEKIIFKNPIESVRKYINHLGISWEVDSKMNKIDDQYQVNLGTNCCFVVSENPERVDKIFYKLD